MNGSNMVGRRGQAPKNAPKKGKASKSVPAKKVVQAPSPSPKKVERRQFRESDDVRTDEEQEDTFRKVGELTPRTARRWTLEMEQDLCSLWEEETHLYDSTARDYRNSQKPQVALKRFAGALNIDGEKYIIVSYCCGLGEGRAQ